MKECYCWQLHISVFANALLIVKEPVVVVGLGIGVLVEGLAVEELSLKEVAHRAGTSLVEVTVEA